MEVIYMKTEFSILLKDLLREHNMTQAELSEKTGIRPSSISDWINGKYTPKQDKRNLVAKALKVNPECLYLTSEKIQYIASTSHYQENELRNYDKESIDELFLTCKLTNLAEDSKNYSSYYIDPAVNAKAEYARTQEGILLDAAKDLSDEDLDYVVDLVKRLRGK